MTTGSPTRSAQGDSATSRRGVFKSAAALAVGASAMGLASRAAAATTPKTFVVAHGAWSSAWAWKKMRPLIAARGHQVFTPSYTGLGERTHLGHPGVNLDTHITDVVNVLFYEDLHDVVLIGHSYGGMVATGVADRARDRIAQLIYVDAFVPEDGQALVDLTGQGEAIRETAVDGWQAPSNPPSPDTSPEDIAWITPRRGFQPVETLVQPLKLTQGPLTLPRSYIFCTKGAENRPIGQFADKAKAAGWPVHELDASHSPNVTAPEALDALIDRIVSA